MTNKTVTAEQLKAGWGSFETGFVSAWETAEEVNSVELVPGQHYKTSRECESMDYGMCHRKLKALEAEDVAARIIEAGYIATTMHYAVIAAYPA